MHRAGMQPSRQQLLVSNNNEVYAARLQHSYLEAWRRLVIVGPPPPWHRALPSPSAALVPVPAVVPAMGSSASMHFADAGCIRRLLLSNDASRSDGLLLSSCRSISPGSARAPVRPALGSARTPVEAAMGQEPIAGCEPIARAASTSPRETGHAWHLSTSGLCQGVAPTCCPLRGPSVSHSGRARLPCPRGSA